MPIPEFNDYGLLPEGLFMASEAQITFRFGARSRRRRSLIIRVRRWIELARQIGALRLLVDGSFVTSKIEPGDVDSVILLPSDFSEQVANGSEAALELEEMLLTNRPEEIFAAEDELDWKEWVDFFSRTRRLDGLQKGLVEVRL